MKRQLSKSFRPSIEALEDRRVMDAGMASLGWGVIWHASDTNLSALRQTGPPYDPSQEVYVDGSIYDDHVEVLQYVEGANGFVKLKLEQWSGVTMLSSRTVQVNTPNLKFVGWAIHVDLKEGNDRLTNNTAAFMQASGGAGSDILVGGSGNDFLRGDAGRNGLLGREGNDVIYGGDEPDGIRGGPGNDILRGFGGDDWLFGDNDDNAANVVGHDTMTGGAGHDNMFGGAGHDEMRGEQGNDIIWGGVDNDWMWGGDGNDTIHGEAGSDRLYGEGDTDKLYGGADYDYLNGGYGATDYLEGGQGPDTFVRHKRVFWSDDKDIFADYNSATGDKIETNWHA